MAHVIELTDEEYAAIVSAAQARGQTPSDFVRAWAEALAGGKPGYDLEEWFRHLEDFDGGVDVHQDTQDMAHDADA